MRIENVNGNKYYIINQIDNNYPEKLKALDNPPEELCFIGSAGLPATDVPTVAIIGARMCSEYGRYISRQFAEYIAAAGIQIINGMALGVDGIALKAGVKAGGTSFAVLGSGANVCYPEENRILYEELMKHGGIISEFPLGAKPERENFEKRNRIITALADAVLVVEARRKSGTLSVAELANKLGKKVYAIPGRITDRLSDGVNELIKNGAVMVTDPEEVVRQMCDDFQMEVSK